MTPVHLLVVLTGPSGAGKDTVLARLKSLGRPYHFAVTATTRPSRPGEADGVDYYFVSAERFEQMAAQGELLEHAQVYAYRYGVPKAPVQEALKSGKDVILRTDVQGATYIKSIAPDAVTIFIAPPSREELVRRLRTRGRDPEEQVGLRLRTAQEEMKLVKRFDHVVVNDDLERAVEEIEAILSEERARAGRRAPL